MKKQLTGFLIIGALTLALTACQSGAQGRTQSSTQNSGPGITTAVSSEGTETSAGSGSEPSVPGTYSDTYKELMTVSVQMGDDHPVHVAHIYDNDTAVELARNIGSGGKRLPVYNYDDFEGSDRMILYDIPSYHEIPDSETVAVTSVKAGEIYYSHPNRVNLYLEDMEVQGDFTPIGYLEDVEGLVEEYSTSRVLENYDCKVIPVYYMD